jgi:hypothetical protein
LKRILRIYPEAGAELGKATVNRRISRAYASLAHGSFQGHAYANARQLFGRALSYWPSHIQYWPFYLATFLRPSQVAILKKISASLRLLVRQLVPSHERNPRSA